MRVRVFEANVNGRVADLLPAGRYCFQIRCADKISSKPSLQKGLVNYRLREDPSLSSEAQATPFSIN